MTLLAYLFYFVAATASPLQRRLLATKHDGGGQTAFAFRVVLITAVLGLSLFIFFPPEWHGSILQLSLLSLTCGIFGAIFFVSQYSAQRHVDAGITTMLSNLNTPIAIILARFYWLRA